ncbi:MAG: hypothetical protein C4547_15995 [Phycisphaerales bacterium]|nr:MAG: hypothetical protein C4547_15995 [Phycisphaerales bacterium]
MKRWTLDKLLAADRNAGAVFLALVELAAGKRQIHKTRASIRAVCGLSERRITTAMHALRDAGWIRLAIQSDEAKTRSWYAVTLNATLSFEGRKTTAEVRGRHVGKRPPKRRASEDGKRPSPPVRGRGLQPPPLSPDGSGSGAAPPDPQLRPRRTPAEADRMATIRAAREAREARAAADHVATVPAVRESGEGDDEPLPWEGDA